MAAIRPVAGPMLLICAIFWAAAPSAATLKRNAEDCVIGCGNEEIESDLLPPTGTPFPGAGDLTFGSGSVGETGGIELPEDRPEFGPAAAPRGFRPVTGDGETPLFGVPGAPVGFPEEPDRNED